MKSKRIELLAPAGSFESLTATIHAGADAVYIGGNKFGARAYANNFGQDEVLKAIDYAHIHQRKLYLAINTLLKNKEMEELYDYLSPYYQAGIDGVIIQDMGVLQYLKTQFPDLPLHASTQMTVTGVEGAHFMENLGIERIVTAREMDLEEIKQIHKETNLEIESFIHGALCYCYSGQCLFSSMVGGRSGNRGRCAQPCRLPFEVNKQKGIYPLSLKDLCTIEIIPQLIEAGIYSFKIEGRMKQPEYAAGVTSIYRKYIDAYLENPQRAYRVEKKDFQALLNIGNRGGFTKGYYNQKNSPQMITLNNSSYQSEGKEFLEKVREKYIQKELKEKIKGVLRLSKDNSMNLELYCNGTLCLVQGSVVEPAQKQPMLEEKIRKQMLKTGNTPFEFEDLQIEMEESIFVPIQKLNELRRDGLEKLQNELLKKYKRSLLNQISVQNDSKYKKKLPFTQPDIGTQKINVYIEQEAYFPVVLKVNEIEGIYLDINIFKNSFQVSDLEKYVDACHAHDKKCYLALPHIFREEQRKKFKEIIKELCNSNVDGFLVKNIEEIGFLKRIHCNKTLILDHNLYTFNQESLEFWHQESILKDTIPLELNEKELKWRTNENSECIIYGYLPLMVSAQCVTNTLSGCQKSSKIEKSLSITDRYQNKFYMKQQCEYCYNIIYNCKPFVLWDEEEIRKLSVGSVRLHFTIESVEEVEKILKKYIQQFYYKKKINQDFCKDYTKGHFKRGVE